MITDKLCTDSILSRIFILHYSKVKSKKSLKNKGIGFERKAINTIVLLQNTILMSRAFVKFTLFTIGSRCGIRRLSSARTHKSKYLLLQSLEIVIGNKFS